MNKQQQSGIKIFYSDTAKLVLFPVSKKKTQGLTKGFVRETVEPLRYELIEAETSFYSFVASQTEENLRKAT